MQTCLWFHGPTTFPTLTQSPTRSVLVPTLAPVKIRVHADCLQLQGPQRTLTIPTKKRGKPTVNCNHASDCRSALTQWMTLTGTWGFINTSYVCSLVSEYKSNMGEQPDVSRIYRLFPEHCVGLDRKRLALPGVTDLCSISVMSQIWSPAEKLEKCYKTGKITMHFWVFNTPEIDTSKMQIWHFGS